MKTKLTLNVDHKIIERAKKASARRKVSLSSVVEEYLDRFSKKDSDKKHREPSEPSLLERIRKYTKNAKPLPEDFDYKKAWHDHLDEKYGI
jgi:ribosome recycling factor